MSEARLFKCQQCRHEKEMDTLFNFEVCPRCGGSFFPVDYQPPVDWRARAEAAEAEIEHLKTIASFANHRLDCGVFDGFSCTCGFSVVLTPNDNGEVIRNELAQARAMLERLRDANQKAGYEVMRIIKSALEGNNERYLYHENGRSYCRWGLVEKDIRALFEKPEANQ